MVRSFALLSQFREFGLSLSQVRLESAKPINMAFWKSRAGTSSLHRVLALHDLFGQTFNLFEKNKLSSVYGHQSHRGKQIPPTDAEGGIRRMKDCLANFKPPLVH